MYSNSATATGAAVGFLFLFVELIFLAMTVITVAGMWAMFSKAGKPGWAAIIPIYNTITLLQVGGLSGWWFLGLCVPFLDIFLWIYVTYAISSSFGGGIGTFFLLFILPVIGYPMLGFGSARYVGGGGGGGGMTGNPLVGNPGAGWRA